MATDIPQITGPGNFDIEVVGEGFYQTQFVKVCGPRRPAGYDDEVRVHLVLESDNKFDKLAVGVMLGGGKVGHLSKDVAREFRRAVKAGGLTEYTIFECAGNVRGGWDKGGSNTGQFGIWLDLPDDEDEEE